MTEFGLLLVQADLRLRAPRADEIGVRQRGNLGRNTLIGPNLVSIDASLGKMFELGEGRSLQFRAEVFNLPNHPNFSVPSGLIVFTNATAQVAPNFGRITSTTTTSRQIQLGLKFTF